MRNFLTKFYSVIACVLICSNCFALSPEQRLQDQSLEERAMKMFLEVRCLTCEGQVIENSDSEFSYEMRQLIRKEISNGKNDQEIRKILINQFGPDILLESKYNRNLVLWILPFIFAILTGFFLWKKNKKH